MKRDAVLLVACALLVLAPELGRRDHWSSAEGRPAVIARDMLATGRVFPPHLAGEPYLNKPPLYHGLTALSVAAFGDHEAAARLPALIAAVLAALMTFHAAAARAGLWAGLFLLGCNRFTTLARSSELETLLTACTLLTLLGLRRAIAIDREAGDARRGLVVAALGTALSTWVKGPMLALLFPALYLAGEALLRRSAAPLLRPGLLALPLAAGLATLAFYGPVVASGIPFEELRERLALENVLHVRGPFHYIGVLPAGMIPAIFLLPVMIRALREHGRALGPWLAFAALGFVAFSLFPSKQSHYLLPLYPALAVWGGVAIASALARGRGRRVVAAAGLVVGLLFPALAVAAAARLDGLDLDLFDALWLALVALAGLTGALLVRRRDVGARARELGALLAALAVLSATSAADALAGAALDPERSERAAMTRFAELARGRALFTTDGSISALYYLDRPDVRIVDVEEAGRLLRADPRARVIVERDADERVPAALAGFPREEAWLSPSGKRGFVLLGGGA